MSIVPANAGAEQNARSQDDFTSECATELGPALVVMDLSLPVVDGWEATRRIKANPATARIPVIALTAHAMSGDEERAKTAGCDDFLTKPVYEDLLFAKLRRWLS